MASLKEWVAGKVAVDSSKGCKVKGISVNGSVAGWCGIQFENGSYDLAIVLDQEAGGLGGSVFKDVRGWSSDLSMHHAVVHLFNPTPKN